MVKNSQEHKLQKAKQSIRKRSRHLPNQKELHQSPLPKHQRPRRRHRLHRLQSNLIKTDKLKITAAHLLR